MCPQPDKNAGTVLSCQLYPRFEQGHCIQYVCIPFFQTEFSRYTSLRPTLCCSRKPFLIIISSSSRGATRFLKLWLVASRIWIFTPYFRRSPRSQRWSLELLTNTAQVPLYALSFHRTHLGARPSAFELVPRAWTPGKIEKQIWQGSACLFLWAYRPHRGQQSFWNVLVLYCPPPVGELHEYFFLSEETADCCERIMKDIPTSLRNGEISFSVNKDLLCRLLIPLL